MCCAVPKPTTGPSSAFDMRRSHRTSTSSDGDPPPYSLPHVDAMSGHDDWTTAKDRTMKKRIQNRVAQRTYRQRTKDRMADLQSKLDNCERKLRSKEHDYKDGAERSSEPPALSRDSLQSPSAVESPPETRSPPLDGSLSSVVGTTKTKNVEREVFEFFDSIFAEQCDRNNEIGIEGIQEFSPLTIDYIQEKDSSQSGNCSTDAQQTFSKFTNGEPDCFTLGNGSSLEPYLSTAFSSCDSSSITNPSPQVPWTDDVRPGEKRDGRPSISMPQNMDIAMSITCKEAPLPPTNDSTGMDMNERVGCILKHIETMGFENFDELVHTYYGQQFGEESFICTEQRLSRNRRLPGVIAGVFCAATGWSAWERRGFHEEILKATEAMLISESLEAQNDLQLSAARVLEAPNSALPTVASIVSPLKKGITSKLPNLWALMMALASSTNPGWNKDHSGTILAAILLLHCAGRMEKNMVVELVRLCL